MSKNRKLPAWMVANKDSENSSQNQKISSFNSGKSEKSLRVLPPSFDSNNLEENLPLLQFTGKISYVLMKDECNFICYEIIERSKNEEVVCGFDIEWKVGFKSGIGANKTALLQICMSYNICYIFQLSSMNGFPVELKNLIENENIKKAGVGISGDMMRLMNDFNLKPAGIVDLSSVSNELNKTTENWSLNGLLINLFKRRLNKDRKIRCSDWEKCPLTEEQLEYAALDAYASWIIYKKLTEDS